MPDARPRITITYCTQCQWLLRAGWMAQELLSTFATDLGEVVLVPGTGGIFTITCNEQLIWDRKRDGGFPDAAKLKQLVRDVIDPERDLGHADRKPAGPGVAIAAGLPGRPLAARSGVPWPAFTPHEAAEKTRSARSFQAPRAAGASGRTRHRHGAGHRNVVTAAKFSARDANVPGSGW